MAGSLLLEIKNLRKEYPGVVALNDLSLSFQPGEVHAIVGENGAGKSTLINLGGASLRRAESRGVQPGAHIGHGLSGILKWRKEK